MIWLRGLGTDGNDFAPIVPELLRTEWPAIRFVFPHAPGRAVTINGGARMRAWYDIRDFDLANHADHEGVADSVAKVGRIAREVMRGIKAEHILLAGFSQGGAVTICRGYRARARGGRDCKARASPAGSTLRSPISCFRRITCWGVSPKSEAMSRKPRPSVS